VALHDFVVGQHHLLEALEGIRRRPVQRYLDIGEEAEPKLAGAEAGEVPLDVAVRLQAANPLQRRRDSEIHFPGELGNGNAAVLL